MLTEEEAKILTNALRKYKAMEKRIGAIDALIDANWNQVPDGVRTARDMVIWTNPNMNAPGWEYLCTKQEMLRVEQHHDIATVVWKIFGNVPLGHGSVEEDVIDAVKDRGGYIEEYNDGYYIRASKKQTAGKK